MGLDKKLDPFKIWIELELECSRNTLIKTLVTKNNTRKKSR